MDTSELLQSITSEEKARKSTEGKDKKKYSPIVPVPDDAPPFGKDTCAYHNALFGKFSDHIHLYKLADGSRAMYVVRWDGVKQKDGTLDKEIRPYIYGTDAAGNTGWYSQFLDERPLYNLAELSSNRKDILFVEGEKTAEAARILFPDYSVTTTAGGSGSAHKTDFSPVSLRNVLISPDCGEAGHKYADHVYTRCRKAGAWRVQKFDTQTLAMLVVEDGKVVDRDPTAEPAKANYDLADALADGWTAELMAAHRDKFIGVYMEKDAEIIGKYKLNRTGVYKLHLDEQGQETEEPTWICPYLKVTHQVRDKKDASWSKVFTFYDPNDHLKTVVIPNALLAGDGKEVREKLADEGFSVMPQKGYREAFNMYIHFSNPKEFATSIKKVGWFEEGIYVLPNKIYGDTEGQYIQQIPPHHTPQIHIKGDLKGWQENVAKYAEGNSRLIMAITTPLVAPFLTPLQIDGHIFNLYGNSSIGKSSALAATSSVTGFEMNNFLNTNNSMESVMVSHNDSCMAVDELGLANPDKIGAFAYMVANGKTKGRANQKGNRIDPDSFRNNAVVTGETTLDGKMGEGKLKPTAGQEVRFVDIPADAGCGFGIFENTHGMPPEQLSDHFRQASARYKGTAFDALLDYITPYSWNEIAKSLSPDIKAFKAMHLEALQHKAVSGQVHRVLAYFAVYAAVGELCINRGILPWKPGTVANAYTTLFKEWLRNRGSTGESRELKEVIDNINRLCQQQISRFDFEEHNGVKHATSHSRAGVMKRNDAGQMVYCIFPQVFKDEVMGGKDEKVILPELIRRGILKVGQNGKRTIATRINRSENPVKMYHLTPSGSEEKADDVNTQEEINLSGCNTNVVPFPVNTGSDLDFKKL